MNAPMILPWLASKWNVDQQRTLQLWQLACADAEATVGAERTSAYWALARERWIDLLDQEVIASYPVIETPWIMIRLNLLRLAATVRFWFNARRGGFATA